MIAFITFLAQFLERLDNQDEKDWQGLEQYTGKGDEVLKMQLAKTQKAHQKAEKAHQDAIFAENAKKDAQNYTWDKRVEKIYNHVQNFIKMQS